MPQFALLLTTFIWAATFPATKVALQEISPIAFLLLRFLVSTIAVGAVMIVMKQPLRLNTKTLRLAIATTTRRGAWASRSACSRHAS